ncbi:hypothetical protein BGZ72_009341 [Mortierella alpina]|nr:hypothetical protein BGZ72_009341 [Mortierella alpina]
MHKGLRALRGWLLFLSIGVATAGTVLYYGRSGSKNYTWQMWCQLILCYIFLVTYLLSLILGGTPFGINRFLRALVLVGLTVLSLYINIVGLHRPLDRGLTPARYIDSPSDSDSLGWFFIHFVQAICAILGFFSLAEIGLTLRWERDEKKATSSIDNPEGHALADLPKS